MTETIHYNNDEIAKYVADEYEIHNADIYLLSSDTNTYNTSLSKFYKKIKDVKDTCSHVSKDTIPIIIKAKDLNSISIDKSIHFYFCPSCKTYITHGKVNTSSVETILYKNSLGKNLHTNKLEQKKSTCMNKIKSYMKLDCKCAKDVNMSDLYSNKECLTTTDNLKTCNRCKTLQQQLTKLALLEVQRDLQEK